MASLFVMCIAVPDGTAKMPKARREPGGAKYWRLPRPHWFQQLLTKNEGNALLKPATKSKKHNLLEGLMLLKLKPGATFNGLQTPWSQEDFLLFAHHGHPWDAFTMSVSQAVVFSPPIMIPVPATQTKSPLMVARDMTIPPTTEIRCAAANNRGRALNEHQMCTLLQIPPEEWNVIRSAILCIHVPEPILHLINRKAWTAVMFRQSWMIARRLSNLRGIFQNLGFPPHEWVEQLLQSGRINSMFETPPVAPAALFRESAARTATHLRAHFGKILAGMDDDDDEATSASDDLERVLHHLDQLSGIGSTTPPRLRYEPETLVRSLLTAMRLRNRGELGQVVMDSLATVFPELRSNAARDSVLPMSTHRLPTASTLSKRQLQLDAALCLHWRKKFLTHKFVFFLRADASPQAGNDWLLSLVQMVQQDKLPECLHAAQVLWNSVQQIASAVEADNIVHLSEAAHARAKAAHFLRSHLELHRQVPTAIGSGAASLDQKAKLLVHKFLVESPSPRAAADLLSCVRAVCVDLGTEVGFPDITGATAADYLPSWLRSQSSDGIESDVEHEHKAACLDLPDDCEHLMPHALVSPGILHIVNNMADSMTQALPHFADWLPGFKAVAHLLGTGHLRKRFVATCLVGRFTDLQSLFAKNLASITKWRWSTIVNVVSELLPLKAALIAAWDPQKFLMQSAQEGGVEGRGPGHLETALITSSIRDKKWWVYTHMVFMLHKWADTVGKWAEGCACHFWLRSGKNSDGQDMPAHSRELLLSATRTLVPPYDVSDGPDFQCPLAGRRGVELACGELNSHLRSVTSNFLAELLPLCMELSEPDADHILSDYRVGAAHMELTIQQKLFCWTTLPWKLCGLGAPAEGTARRIAAECLREFDAFSP